MLPWKHIVWGEICPNMGELHSELSGGPLAELTCDHVTVAVSPGRGRETHRETVTPVTGKRHMRPTANCS